MLSRVIIERRRQARELRRRQHTREVGLKRDANELVFPVACPRCTAKAGRPFRAEQVSDQELEVRLRCDQCSNEWHLEMDAPPLLRAPARSFPK